MTTHQRLPLSCAEFVPGCYDFAKIQRRALDWTAVFIADTLIIDGKEGMNDDVIALDWNQLKWSKNRDNWRNPNLSISEISSNWKDDFLIGRGTMTRCFSLFAKIKIYEGAFDINIWLSIVFEFFMLLGPVRCNGQLRRNLSYPRNGFSICPAPDCVRRNGSNRIV